eukprot:g20789.t1
MEIPQEERLQERSTRVGDRLDVQSAPEELKAGATVEETLTWSRARLQRAEEEPAAQEEHVAPRVNAFRNFLAQVCDQLCAEFEREVMQMSEDIVMYRGELAKCADLLAYQLGKDRLAFLPRKSAELGGKHMATEPLREQMQQIMDQLFHTHKEAQAELDSIMRVLSVPVVSYTKASSIPRPSGAPIRSPGNNPQSPLTQSGSPGQFAGSLGSPTRRSAVGPGATAALLWTEFLGDENFEFDTMNPAFQEVYTNLLKYWIAYADIDGFRVSSAAYISSDFTAYLSTHTRFYASKLGKERFFVLGEIDATEFFGLQHLGTTGKTRLPYRTERAIEEKTEWSGRWEWHFSIMSGRWNARPGFLSNYPMHEAAHLRSVASGESSPEHFFDSAHWAQMQQVRRDITSVADLKSTWTSVDSFQKPRLLSTVSEPDGSDGRWRGSDRRDRTEFWYTTALIRIRRSCPALGSTKDQAAEVFGAESERQISYWKMLEDVGNASSPIAMLVVLTVSPSPSSAPSRYSMRGDSDDTQCLTIRTGGATGSRSPQDACVKSVFSLWLTRGASVLWLAVPFLVLLANSKSSVFLSVVKKPTRPSAPLSEEPRKEAHHVLCAAIEHTIPTRNVKVSAGGLGKVLDQMLREHPKGLLSLVHPKCPGARATDVEPSSPHVRTRRDLVRPIQRGDAAWSPSWQRCFRFSVRNAAAMTARAGAWREAMATYQKDAGAHTGELIMGALMAITGAFNTAAEATVSVGVASIGGVVTVAGLAITGAISATHLAIAPMAAPHFLGYSRTNSAAPNTTCRLHACPAAQVACQGSKDEELPPHDFTPKLSSERVDTEVEDVVVGTLSGEAMSDNGSASSKSYSDVCIDPEHDSDPSDPSNTSPKSSSSRRWNLGKGKTRKAAGGVILGGGDDDETGEIITSAALGINIDNPGKITDFYDVGRSIGEGSFGSVFKASVKATEAIRAVKRIPLPKAGRDKDTRLDFLKEEIRVAKLLDHPTLGPQRARTARGNGGICHRDLKSENMLLVLRPPAKKGTKHAHSKFEILKRNCGTDSHKAPQVYAHAYNYKCDVWACGVIMYFLLSCRLPFEGRDAEELHKKLREHRALGAARGCSTGEGASWRGEEWMSRSGEAMNLAKQMLMNNEANRMEAAQALKHKWFSKQEILHSLRGFRKLNKFRKVSLAVIASMLPEKVIRPGRDLFVYLDKDGDGEVTLTELRESMEELKKNKPTDAGIASEELVGRFPLSSSMRWEIFSDVRRKNTEPAAKPSLHKQASFQADGQYPAFSYTEFLAATFDRSKHSTEAVCRAAFRCFDKDGSGQLEPSELVDGYLLGKLEAEEVERIMEELDANGDGEIDFQEFMTMIAPVVRSQCLRPKQRQRQVDEVVVNAFCASHEAAVLSTHIRPTQRQAGVAYIKEMQAGHGVCAVSTNYALDLKRERMLFRGLPNILPLDNATDPAEDQGAAGLRVLAGNDILKSRREVQIVLAGPPDDAFGLYAQELLAPLKPLFKGRLFVCTEFFRLPNELRRGAHLCLTPSCSEPFGYVDVEFGLLGEPQYWQMAKAATKATFPFIIWRENLLEVAGREGVQRELAHRENNRFRRMSSTSIVAQQMRVLDVDADAEFLEQQKSTDLRISGPPEAESTDSACFVFGCERIHDIMKASMAKTKGNPKDAETLQSCICQADQRLSERAAVTQWLMKPTRSMG